MKARHLLLERRNLESGALSHEIIPEENWSGRTEVVFRGTLWDCEEFFRQRYPLEWMRSLPKWTEWDARRARMTGR